MKTLIYDSECPLCSCYTSIFVKTGVLENDGRKNFNEVGQALLAELDTARMRNEIPLIDSHTGEKWYGVDALLELVESRVPTCTKVGRLPAVNWFLKKLYKLVSLNRKVMVAIPARGYDCSPDFSLRYRILFLLIGLVFNSWLFTLRVPMLSEYMFPSASSFNLQMVHFTLVSLNITIAILLGLKQGLEYLGQVNMLALLALIATLPASWLISTAGSSVTWFYLGAVSLFIAREYFRRMYYASILSKYKTVVFINMICIAAAACYLALIN